MNPLSLMLSFAPWLVLKIISGVPIFSNPLVMLKIAISVASLICLYQSITAKVRGFIFWGTIISFAFNFVSVVLMGNMWVISHLGIISQLLMNAIVWGSILARRPFTIDYAKQSVPREMWTSPRFMRKNYTITAIWGLYFLIGLGLGEIRLYEPQFSHFILEILDNGSMVMAVMATSLMTRKRPMPVAA